MILIYMYDIINIREYDINIHTDTSILINNMKIHTDTNTEPDTDTDTNIDTDIDTHTQLTGGFLIMEYGRIQNMEDRNVCVKNE